MIGIIIGMCTLVISLVILSYKYYKLNIKYAQVKQDYLNTSSEIVTARNTIDETAQRIKILERKIDDYEKYARVMKVEKFLVEPVTVQTELRFDTTIYTDCDWTNPEKAEKDCEFLKNSICRQLSEVLYSYLKEHDELYRYEIYKDPILLIDVVKVQMRLYPFVKEENK